MFAIGNEELEKAQKIGDFVFCKMCGKRHKIEFADEVLPDGTKIPSKALALYRCGGESYLAGINGKKIEGDDES